jgi:predicted dehydrogenase
MAERTHVAVLTQAGAAHLDAYFAALAATDEVERVSLADASGASVAAARRALGDKLGEVYQQHDELLKRERPGMALVSMEAASSPPVIEAALEAGCHVYAEKPACVAAADFRRLVAKADSKHRLLMLALANRIIAPVRQARELVRDGSIGKIYAVEMHLVADQTRLRNPNYSKTWFAKRDRAGGGFLIWLGIHWLDLAMHITGAEVRDVAALAANVGGQPIEVEDAAAVAMQFENDALGTLTAGYYLDRGYHSHLKIWGSQGWLHLEHLKDIPLVWQSYGGSQSGEVQQFRPENAPTGYTPYVRAAVRAALELDEPPITNQESLRAIETVFACYKSAETGQRQRL